MNLKEEEEFLLNPKIHLEKKIPTLLTIWLSLKNLILRSKSVDRAIVWAQRHTLTVVLQGDWNRLSTELKNSVRKVVQEVDTVLKQNKNIPTSSCKILLDVMDDPWGNATLKDILLDTSKSQNEKLIDFFANESGYLIAMRLNKLCQDKCEDLALKLAKTTLQCLRMPNSLKFHAVITEGQKLYILDVYIALLFIFHETQLILNELKRLNLSEGLRLVNRFTKKQVQVCELWRYAPNVAELAANYFITAAMTQRIEDCGAYLADFLKARIICDNKLGVGTIQNTIRKIIQAADSSSHIYICIEVLNSQYGESIKPFTTELFIRALTTDMNELEKQKQKSDIKKVEETSKRLAKGFLSLADIWESHLNVCRECVLTSFSLNPTITCMERIQKCAELSLNNERPLSSELKLNGFNNISNIDHSKHTSTFTNSELHKVLTPEALGLPEQLCDDLVVVISSPRYQFLSWVLTWPELKAECESYLNNSQGKNVVKELKFLHIDYNQFKDWPEVEDDSSGIEKGYEQFTEDDDDDLDFVVENNNDSDDSTNNEQNTKRRRKGKSNSSDSDWAS